MATHSVSIGDVISREDGVDIGILGLISVLSRQNYADTPKFNQLGKLTDSELLTVTNQVSNVQAATVNGLRTLSDMVMAFDPDKSEFDRTGISWLMRHLTDTLAAVLDIDSSAALELAARGYNCIGQPIRRPAQGMEAQS